MDLAAFTADLDLRSPVVKQALRLWFMEYACAEASKDGSPRINWMNEDRLVEEGFHLAFPPPHQRAE